MVDRNISSVIIALVVVLILILIMGSVYSCALSKKERKQETEYTNSNNRIASGESDVIKKKVSQIEDIINKLKEQEKGCNEKKEGGCVISENKVPCTVLLEQTEGLGKKEVYTQEKKSCEKRIINVCGMDRVIGEDCGTATESENSVPKTEVITQERKVSCTASLSQEKGLGYC